MEPFNAFCRPSLGGSLAQKQPFAWVTVLCFPFHTFENALQNSKHFVACCTSQVMHFLYKYLPQLHALSACGWGWREGLDQLRRTSRQPSLQFQLVLLHVVGSEMLTIETSLKTPCETWPCLPCFDTIYVGDHAARWETCMVSRLWSLQPDRVLGVPLKFHRNTILTMENKKSWTSLEVNIRNLKSTMRHKFNISCSPLLWDMQILVIN